QPTGIRHPGATRSADILDRALSKSTCESDAPKRDQHHCLHVAREGRAVCSPLCRGDSTTAGGQRRAAEDPGPIAMSLYGADLLALLPELVVVVAACLVISLDPITPASRRDLLAWLSVGALALCLGLTGWQISMQDARVDTFSDWGVRVLYA